MSAGSISPAAVTAAVAGFPDPETGRGIGVMEQVRNVTVDGNNIRLTLELTSHSAPLWSEARDAVVQRLQSKFPGANITVDVTEHKRPPMRLGQIGLTAKSVIAVGSGKGGVGKSTIAASLAIGLSKAGCKVGLMDADVYGPSVPHLLGMTNAPRPEIVNGKLPAYKHGELAVMSIGFMVPPGEAVVWRGPMLHSAMTQFLRDVSWGDLDYLIIDMPPGTGDIALTLSQLLPLTGAVVVCTPQDVALIDAVKAIAMFRKVNIPVLGMVENMSGFICPDNGKRYDIFGRGGAMAKADELKVPFLGDVPINIQLRENGDAGKTTANFDDPLAKPYLDRLVYNLSKQLADSAKAKPPMPSLPVLG